MRKYFGGWSSRDGIASSFSTDDVPPDEAILFAGYSNGGYEGDAIVVFERDGELLEVNGSHCSCSGLEYQWEPEPTTWGALAMRQLYHHDADTSAALHTLAVQRRAT